MSHSAKKSNLFTVALVGAAALKGKEVRDVLSERNFPAVDIKLLDEEEALGQLDQVNDEPAFIQGVLPEHLEGVDFAFLTADESFIAKVWASVRDSGAEIIDLSYALENNTDVALRAPWVEKELGHIHEEALQSGPVVIAHPAAVVLAILLGRLQTVAPLRIASAVIGQPASEYGRRGMDELHDQTINLLSFQQLPTACFGTQVAFNLFVQSNETARPSLAQSEARILRHFRTIAEKSVAEPAVLLVQTPVFHGYAIAIFVQTASAATAEALEAALAGPHVTVVSGAEDFPSNVNVAGSPEILVSLRGDGAGGNGFWLFAACDNLRVSAIQAVECAEEMVHTRPRGQLQ
ncbi:MAG: Asd/ArgC dimerization domain-containing protein [Candidatus Korobacteraceae bacterium]